MIWYIAFVYIFSLVGMERYYETSFGIPQIKRISSSLEIDENLRNLTSDQAQQLMGELTQKRCWLQLKQLVRGIFDRSEIDIYTTILESYGHCSTKNVFLALVNANEYFLADALIASYLNKCLKTKVEKIISKEFIGDYLTLTSRQVQIDYITYEEINNLLKRLLLPFSESLHDNNRKNFEPLANRIMRAIHRLNSGANNSVYFYYKPSARVIACKRKAEELKKRVEDLKKKNLPLVSFQHLVAPLEINLKGASQAEEIKQYLEKELEVNVFTAGAGFLFSYERINDIVQKMVKESAHISVEDAQQNVIDYLFELIKKAEQTVNKKTIDFYYDPPCDVRFLHRILLKIKKESQRKSKNKSIYSREESIKVLEEGS